MSRSLKAMMLAGLLPLLGACGFTPLYAEPGLVGRLNSIDIETPQTRTGYLLHEELEDALAAKHEGPAQYHLAVQVQERRRARGLNPDDTPTRYELRLEVTYTLSETAGGKVLLKRTRPVFVSADASDQPYAGIAAQQDSEARAASEAAEMIKTDVALALRSN